MHPPSSMSAARMAPALLAIAACALAPAAHAAGNCETLRADIEARIAATGVTRFTVTAVPADAVTAGRVVGTCELGSRKIVYERQDGPARARGAPMITECRDGSEAVGGRCGK